MNSNHCLRQVVPHSLHIHLPKSCFSDFSDNLHSNDSRVIMFLFPYSYLLNWCSAGQTSQNAAGSMLRGAALVVSLGLVEIPLSAHRSSRKESWCGSSLRLKIEVHLQLPVSARPDSSTHSSSTWSGGDFVTIIPASFQQLRLNHVKAADSVNRYPIQRKSNVSEGRAEPRTSNFHFTGDRR